MNLQKKRKEEGERRKRKEKEEEKKGKRRRRNERGRKEKKRNSKAERRNGNRKKQEVCLSLCVSLTSPASLCAYVQGSRCANERHRFGNIANSRPTIGWRGSVPWERQEASTDGTGNAA